MTWEQWTHHNPHLTLLASSLLLAFSASDALADKAELDRFAAQNQAAFDSGEPSGQDVDCHELMQNNFALWQKQCSTQLDDIIVVATRTPFRNALYAGQVATLNSEKLGESASLTAALQKIPGVVVHSGASRQINSAFFIRGYSNQSGIERVLVEQDGVARDTTTPSSQISSSRVDTDLLTSVEVVKGSSSILHGAGVIGGAVSMRTKDARDYLLDGQKIGMMLGGRYDSNNARSYRAAIYAKPNELDALLYFKRAHYDDVDLPRGGVTYTSGGRTVHQDRYENDEQVNTVFAKVGYDFAPHHRLSLSAFHYRDKLLTGWNTGWASYRDNATAGIMRQRDIVLDYQYKPSDWLNLTAKAYTSNFTYDRRNVSAAIGDHYLNQDRRNGLTIKNESRFTTGTLQHQLVMGVDYQLRRQSGEHINNGDNITLGMLPAQSRDLGIYVQDNIRFNRLMLTLGGRYDYGSRQLNGLPAPNSSGHFSPKIAVAYEAATGINLLAGYSETFRLPSVIELGLTKAPNPFYYYIQNRNLKPETAREFEMGFSVNRQGVFAEDDRLNFKATYFTGRIQDMIALRVRSDIMGSDGLPKPSDADMGIYTWRPRAERDFAQYQNFSRVKRTGFEAVLNYHVNNWSLGATYEHLNIKASDGTRPVSTADKIGLSAAYLFEPIDLKVSVEAQHWLKPRLARPTAIEDFKRPHTLVDLKATWTPRTRSGSWFNNSQVSLGVNNVFDQRYTSASSTPSNTAVGVGRNVYFNFEKRF